MASNSKKSNKNIICTV